MVNSVRVVLLKARGWRGTSLPRVYDNMWFSNPVRFCFFQLRSGCEKAEPVPGSFHAFIYSPRSSFHSPTWGYQRHNSYRVAMFVIVIYSVKWCKLQCNLCKLFYDLIEIVRWSGINYSTDSLSLYDDGGYCVSSWRRGVRTTRYELCFWKPVVGEERAYLGGVIAGDFQTRYGFCFFQLRSGCEKTEPVPGSFHRSFKPHVAHSIRQRGAFKSTTRTELTMLHAFKKQIISGILV